MTSKRCRRRKFWPVHMCAISPPNPVTHKSISWSEFGGHRSHAVHDSMPTPRFSKKSSCPCPRQVLPKTACLWPWTPWRRVDMDTLVHLAHLRESRTVTAELWSWSSSGSPVRPLTFPILKLYNHGPSMVWNKKTAISIRLRVKPVHDRRLKMF